MMKLRNHKRERFCNEYIIDNNGYQAACRAGYSEISARKYACNLLKLDEIRDRIDELQAETFKKLEMDREEILKKAFRMTQTYDKLEELATKENPTEEDIEIFERLKQIIKATDSNKAIETLLKANGWNEPDKIDMNIKEFKAKFGD